MIRNASDLGADTLLWRRPGRYARFLSAELASSYRGRLLVAMPSGFGFAWPGHRTAAAYRTLAPLMPGAATRAVQRLAAADPAPADDTNRDRVTIAVGVLALVLLGAAARSLSRRRVRG